MWTNHLTLSRSVWYMDGWFLLQAGGGGGRAVACLSTYYKTQIQCREREKCFSVWIQSSCMWEALLIFQVWLLQEWFFLPLHLQVNCLLQTGETVLSAALKGESWSTSWQLSLATEAETTQCSSSERTGFRGCQILSALSSTLATKSNHLIEMWEATDISVFPWLSPLSHSSLSVINCLDGWFPLSYVDRNALLLSSDEGQTIHPPVPGLTTMLKSGGQFSTSWTG